MAKYLYGLSVQRIQSFIFETGKLKEIIGASEFVEQVCTVEFPRFLGGAFKQENLIVGAAGKVIYLFEDKSSCEKTVYEFCQSVWVKMPGMKLTQAVVELEQKFAAHTDFKLLEERLEAQNHKVANRHGMGLMISERSRRTGGPAIKIRDEEDEYLDRNQQTKLKYQKGNNSLFEKILSHGHSYKGNPFALEPEQMLLGEDAGWIAVVHADGNNLGRIIQAVSENATQELKTSDKLEAILKSFSKLLDDATRQSAKDAFNKVVAPVFESEAKGLGSDAKLPLRPVILGGDDLTLIMRGELAIPFVCEYLKRFEYHTQNNFQELVTSHDLGILQNGLSACAGIAFIKPSYPLHYGIKLSDSLCSYAKRKAKEMSTSITPFSCLAFHRVQSAFVEDYSQIIKKELTTSDDIKLSSGPYFLEAQEGCRTIDDLLKQVLVIQTDDAPKAPVRAWLTTLFENKEKAAQLMERIRQINPAYIKSLDLENAIKKVGAHEYTHLSDVIALESIGKIKKEWIR